MFDLILTIHVMINPDNCQKRIPAEQCHITVSLGSTRVRRSKEMIKLTSVCSAAISFSSNLQKIEMITILTKSDQISFK